MYYCPYCNRHDRKELTDEHVIPRSIGGDHRTLIRVCKPCNSEIGAKTDSKLARHTYMRWAAIQSGAGCRGPNRQEKHASTAKLHDGTELVGHMHVEWLNEKEFIHTFEPSGVQSDGRKWFTQAQLADHTGPEGCHILQPDEVNYTSIYVQPGEEADLEPAMLKIILGIRYLSEGNLKLIGSSYDPIRAGMRGVLDGLITWTWIDVQNQPHLLPKPCSRTMHLIWEGCPDGDHYKVGVCLFGCFCVEFSIRHFGLRFPTGTCLLSALPQQDPRKIDLI